MASKVTIKLGDVCRDSASGFVGKVVAHTEWLYSSDTYSLRALKLDKNGKPIDDQWFPVEQLKITKKATARK
jgi:hypothetical protein